MSLDEIVAVRTRVRSAMDQMTEQVDADVQSISRLIADGDVFAFQAAKRLAAKHQVRAEYLVSLDESLSNFYQRRYMENGMAERMGGRRMLMLFEALILVLIVLVLGLLMYDLAAGPDSSRPAFLSSSSIFAVDAFCCAIFMGEFVLRLRSADSKRYVWKHHWVDFVTSIPVPGEAQLARFGRFARLARFARLLRLLRFARLFFFLWRGLDKLQDVMDVKVMKKTIRWAVFATFAGAILIYKIEGGSAANSENAVSTFGQSAWWSFTTVLTGGFGDIHNPESISGQVLTGFLVVIGMVLVGVFTATLTSIFVGERQDDEDVSLDQIVAKLDELTRLQAANGDSERQA
ncbi:potassium channel family protein [Novipirellula galeiformis]|uniref:potassium channel family protein n=1 Tax=Novipirellula galeiformis TaxID=2528004 RepID=UPI0011B3F5B4|nr:potassium channel family protein [Novipirellula galeiformis]